MVLLKENYNFSTTCKRWGKTNSTKPLGELLCLKAQQGWYWLLNHVCLWWNPTEISLQIYVYNRILSCHSTISYGVVVQAIYVSSPIHQCVFCHWVSVLYYPLAKCFDKLFFYIPFNTHSKTLHKIAIYRINKSHWEAHAICLTERRLLSRGQKASRQVQSQEGKDLPVSPRSSNTREPEEPSSKPLRHSNASGAARLISSNKTHSPLVTAWAKVP